MERCFLGLPQEVPGIMVSIWMQIITDTQMIGFKLVERRELAMQGPGQLILELIQLLVGALQLGLFQTCPMTPI